MRLVFDELRNGDLASRWDLDQTGDFLIEGGADEIIEPKVLIPSLGANITGIYAKYVAGASRVPATPKTHERYPIWLRNKPPKKL